MANQQIDIGIRITSVGNTKGFEEIGRASVSYARQAESLTETAREQGIEFDELQEIMGMVSQEQVQVARTTERVTQAQIELGREIKTVDAYMADLGEGTQRQEKINQRWTYELGQIHQQMEANRLAYERNQGAIAETEENTERLIADFKNEDQVLTELNRRLAQHKDRLDEVARTRPDASKYEVGGVVRSFEREEYEQRRFDVDEQRWQRRRAQINDETEMRQNLNRTYYEGREEERRAYRESQQASRDAYFASQKQTREWERRKQAVIGFVEDGIFAAITAVGVFSRESVQAYAQFDSLTRQVATINDAAASNLSRFRDETRLLSREMNVLPDTMAQTLYMADSLGSNNIMDDARLASMGAVAGYTEANKVLEATLKTQNAFAEGMYDNEQVMDLFFTGVDRGAFSMDDLAGGISAVTSVAGETLTPLEDIMAALVVMTKQGDDFNEAVELSSLLLSQLGMEGTSASTAFMEATGQSYREFIAAGGDLAGAMEALQGHAKATGKSIGELIAGDSPFYRDQQAARAAMELTGHHLVKLRQETDAMSDSAGAMGEAYSIMAEGAEQDIRSLEVAYEDIKLATGEWLMSLQLVQQTLDAIPQALSLMSGGKSFEVETLINNQASTGLGADAAAAEVERLKEALTDTDVENRWWLGAIHPALGLVEQSIKGFAGGEISEPIKARISEIASEAAVGAESVEELDMQLKAVFGSGAIESYYNGEDTFFMAEIEGRMIDLGHASDILAAAQDHAAASAAAQAEALKSYSSSMVGYASNYGYLENQTIATAEGFDLVAQKAASVAKVLDGDTIRLDSGVDVRLNAINTPETAKSFLGKIGMPFGNEATAFTQEFLIDPEITLDVRGEDDYERMLAGVFNAEGQSLEHALVDAGLALPLPVEMTGDEALTAELEQLARNAAETGRGIFEDERIADAYLSGRVENMEEVAAMYDGLAAADKAYYDTYLGYLRTSIDSLDDLQTKLAEAAVNKALLEGDVSKVPAILDMAVAMGVYSEEQAGLQQTYADTMLLIDQQATIMGNANYITQDMSETMQLLSTGLFDTRDGAAFAAEVMSTELVNSFIAAYDEGETLYKVAEDIGLSLDELTKDVTISFVSDTSNYNPPTPQGGSVIGAGGGTPFATGGPVTGGTPGKDSVAALLMPGEYVVRREAVHQLGMEALDAINSGRAGGMTVHLNQTFNITGGDPAAAAEAGREAQRGATAVLNSMGVRRK